MRLCLSDWMVSSTRPLPVSMRPLQMKTRTSRWGRIDWDVKAWHPCSMVVVQDVFWVGRRLKFEVLRASSTVLWVTVNLSSLWVWLQIMLRGTRTDWLSWTTPTGQRSRSRSSSIRRRCA
ncbi:hypothetical protein M011DRAFT_31793 [Sporormia fimetaria CBS 119925]|uniref:Uncharacterized protein n=1 Tax=Sporormia fimetaria CBS 119925 TaxID=1340428 RepID=A0A6A6VE45_9PLEO|nr:hypothetical protein M011DRAFT_31793 [Sporormia fimetaria CBS 119925]